MKSRKTFVSVFLVLAVLFLGVGYAAISNITLKISGNLTATASDENFKVAFTDTKVVISDSKITGEKTDDLNAKIAVTGLTAKGEKVTATYEIENKSADLSASIAVPAITNSNEEYFKVTTDWAEAKTVASKGKVTVTVTVELIKTPIGEDESATVNVSLVASPVQP